ncbi:MAG: hypothetical protein J6B63_04780 [Treponema sp.]|nr:hypothetical protein [Treponema sp.]MBP3606869.1 hypothetical protein [Treponema sp.]
MESRKSQLVATIVSNLVLQLITAVCGFVLPPLIVETFGSSVNGMVSSITQFIAYLNLVEAGIGGAAIAALYLPLCENDHNALNGILSATKKFYNKSGILFTFLILCLAVLYPMFIGTQVDKLSAFLMVLILGVSGTAEFFLIGKYRVLLTADKKVYVISIVQSVSVIANTIVAVIAIKLGAGILFVKFLTGLVNLSRYFVLLFYVQKKYKWLDLNVEPNIEAVSQSKNVLVHQFAGLIVFNSPIIILTIFCSLKDVSVYSVYSLVFYAISMLLNAFSNGMQSFFGESLVKDDIEKSRKFFIRYKIFFTVAECWFYSMTYMLIMPFMSIYTKNMSDANYMQPNLAILFIVVGLLNNVRLPETQLISAAGHFKKTQNRAIIELCINLFFAITCTIIFGFVGVLFGAIASGLYRCTDMVIYSCKNILKTNVLNSVITVLLILIMYGIVIYGASFFRFECIDYFDWIKIALLYGVVFALPIIISFLFVRRKI